MRKDYYRLLNVKKTASDADIKRAFHELALQYHPDLNKGHTAEEQFKEINEAYGVLSDPHKRKFYDLYGTAPRRGAAADQTFSAPAWPGMWFQQCMNRRGRRRGCGKGWWWHLAQGTGAAHRERRTVFQEGNNFICRIFLSPEEREKGARRFLRVQDRTGIRTLTVAIPPNSPRGERILIADNREHPDGRIFIELQDA